MAFVRISLSRDSQPPTAAERAGWGVETGRGFQGFDRAIVRRMPETLTRALDGPWPDSDRPLTRLACQTGAALA